MEYPYWLNYRFPESRHGLYIIHNVYTNEKNKINLNTWLLLTSDGRSPVETTVHFSRTESYFSRFLSSHLSFSLWLRTTVVNKWIWIDEHLSRDDTTYRRQTRKDKTRDETLHPRKRENENQPKLFTLRGHPLIFNSPFTLLQ